MKSVSKTCYDLTCVIHSHNETATFWIRQVRNVFHFAYGLSHKAAT